MNGIVKKLSPQVKKSITDFADSTTNLKLRTAKIIHSEKRLAVTGFFSIIAKQPDKVTIGDINTWHQWLLDNGKSKTVKLEDGTLKTINSGLEESTIYTKLSHLSAYFEWLRKSPELAPFLKSNPVRLAMPKPPKKYNSPKAKSLTDEEFTKLWLYLEKLASDDKNQIAIRDYAIFRLFCGTGMRREEILGLSAGDIKFTSEGLLIHVQVKGGDYQWRTIQDDEVRDSVERYLSVTRRKSAIGDKKRALWIRFDRGKHLALYDKEGNKREAERGLSSHSYDKQIKKYAHEAGIGHFHIHQFRHTFARIVSEDTGSLIETQDALGHSNIETTKVYVKKIQFKKDKHSLNVRKRINPALLDDEE